MQSDTDGASSLVVRHRLLIRHSRERGLAMIDAAGDPKLPMVTTADAHTADTDYINVAVEARFGVKTTVLRSLSHSPPIDGSVERVHELEAHDAPTSVRWCDAPDLAKLDDPEDRRAVALWMQAGGNTQEWTPTSRLIN